MFVCVSFNAVAVWDESNPSCNWWQQWDSEFGPTPSKWLTLLGNNAKMSYFYNVDKSTINCIEWSQIFRNEWLSTIIHMKLEKCEFLDANNRKGWWYLLFKHQVSDGNDTKVPKFKESNDEGYRCLKQGFSIIFACRPQRAIDNSKICFHVPHFPILSVHAAIWEPWLKDYCIHNFNLITKVYLIILHLCFPGIYGGMRAAMMLRAFLGEVGCLSVSNIFGIPKVHNAIDEDGKPLDSHMESGAQKLITQLDWHANAMRDHREKVGTPWWASMPWVFNI